MKQRNILNVNIINNIYILCDSHNNNTLPIYSSGNLSLSLFFSDTCWYIWIEDSLKYMVAHNCVSLLLLVLKGLNY